MIALWVVSFSLVLARVAGFVSILPLLGGPTIPRLVKTGLAFALAIFWFDYTPSPGSLLLTRSTEIDWPEYGYVLGKEAVIGLVLGYAFGLFLVPLRVAGEFLTSQMGLAIGASIDPTAPTPAGPITQLLEMLGTLLFLGLNGHHVFLAVLHRTFQKWPIGGAGPDLAPGPFVTISAAAEEWGLLLIAPVGASVFLMAIILALMARAAPQMNVFSVGFALQIAVGLGAMFFLLPDLVAAMMTVFGRFSEYLLRVV